MAIINMHSRLIELSEPNSVEYYYSMPSVSGSDAASATISVFGEYINSNIQPVGETVIGEDENYKVYYTYNAPFIQVLVLEKATSQSTILSFFSLNSGNVYVCIGYNDEIDRYMQYHAGTEEAQRGYGPLTDNTSLLTRFFQNTPPITYNWQSVPSISGKNGILLMPVLSDTNNGNPVSGASSSAFIKAPSSANNIRNLVDLSLEPTNTDDAATIFYTIPDGTYTSIKLYGKIGENPKCNNTDDIIEDINQNDTSISVENLECEEYYFCIQAITADLTLSSNVVSIDLSFNWDGSEITILWSGDNNRMTAELIESNENKHIKFRMYLGNTLIYQFIGQYVDESLSRTVKDINIGFLIDENNQIGRPSNIYYVSDENDTNYQKYIYNASDETPSDSEMEDIYTWLVAGMD